jgi:tetratricopeptide (TPR) repeat protein
MAFPQRRHIVLLASWIGAALWAVHPIQTEVVAWIKSRDDLLVDQFILLSLHASLNVLASRKIVLSYVAAIVFMILAGLSKDNGILVPGFVFCMPLLFVESRGIYHCRKFLLLVGGLGIVAILTMATRSHVMNRLAQGGYLTGSFSSMMLTMVPAYTRYLQLIFWPFPPTSLLSDYFAYPMEYSLISTRLWLSMAVNLVAAGGLIVICRANKVAWYGLLFFCIAMLPYTNLIPMVQVLAERFLNLPLAGLGLVFAATLAGLRTRNMRCWAFVLSISLLFGYTVCNMARQQVWKNSYALAKDAYFKNTNLRTSICYIGALSEVGNTTESLRVAKYTLQIFPDSLEMQMSMATTLFRQGRIADGEKILKEIISKYPDNAKALSMLSEHYFHEKNFGDAKMVLTSQVHFHPQSSLAWYNLAYANFKLGNKAEARDDIEKCREIDPHTIGISALETKIDSLK